MSVPRTTAVALLATSLLGVTACTADPVPTSGSDAKAPAAAIPQQQVDKALQDKLPAKVKTAGKIVAVNNGSFPPYVIVGTDKGAPVEGATADLSQAVGQLLGIQIEHTTVDGLASVLSGMQAGRYDLDMGPTGDFVERQKQATFIDYVQEYVVFAVHKGNPKGIDGLDTACGKRVAVQAAGSAEKVIKAQSTKCVAAGKPAVDVQSYKDQPSSILAVQSDRADAVFSSQAPLTYFVAQSGGKLELAGVGKGNGFEDLFQGALVPVGSPLADVLLAAIEKLHANGTYDAIMTKWGLEQNKLPTPGLNLGKS
ncbi:polar amino acid transport system substrate-binding protein [Kribbella steppae]|uniref:Polar amino acid transport system substrate-binding protein n=1 Tax=Kribbella steppae TaxID=2512223 RepID=A0A4R2H107_9ACTN|nr:ABC transporter substrate-binding protein [Kribbella steppae]TCO18015.1 polar amino acid transport system substrate-binding protein [Kribbella steppae]